MIAAVYLGDSSSRTWRVNGLLGVQLKLGCDRRVISSKVNLRNIMICLFAFTLMFMFAIAI